MVIWQLDGVESVDHERFRGRCCSGTGSAGYDVGRLDARWGGYTVVWVAPSTISGFGPLFVETVGGPEEGDVHAFGHGFLCGSSAAISLQSRSLAVAPGAVQEITSPVIGWRKFLL